MVWHKYVSRAVGGRGQPFADYFESLNLLADRRNRCGAYNLSSRKNRRRKKLGLSNLLAARRQLHFMGINRSRLLQGRDRLAKLVVARRGRESGPGSDY